MIETWVHRKKTKLPTPWTSNIHKSYKKKTIKVELLNKLHFIKLNEVTLIRNKFKSAGYPMHFGNSIIHEFTTAKTNEANEFIIPPK